MIKQSSKTNKDQSKKIRSILVGIISPRKHHFSDWFAHLVCQIGTQLADHLEMENYSHRTNNGIKGAKKKTTILQVV